MSISNISTQSTHTPPPPPRGGGPFHDVSSLFDMSPEEVADKVRSGSSMEEIADELGVAREDLHAALEDGAPDHLKGSEDLAAIVADIASHSGPGRIGPAKGGPRGPGGADGGGPGGGGRPDGPPPASGVFGDSLTGTQSATLDLLSDLMDMSAEELTEELKSGTDLGTLMQGKGVDLQDLAGALFGSGLLFDTQA